MTPESQDPKCKQRYAASIEDGEILDQSFDDQAGEAVRSRNGREVFLPRTDEQSRTDQYRLELGLFDGRVYFGGE